MDCCELKVHVVPRSSQRKVEVQTDGILKVWIHQAPTDGQANEGVIELLADQLGLPKSRLEIVSGHTARTKMIRVEGDPLESVLTRLRSVQSGTRSPKQKGR